MSGWTEIGTAGVNSSSYVDATVQPVTHYFYRVKASNALGDSGYTNVADATTATAPPLGAGDGLLGQYFDNIDFTGTNFTRVDPTVNFNWGAGSPIRGFRRQLLRPLDRPGPGAIHGHLHVLHPVGRRRAPVREQPAHHR